MADSSISLTQGSGVSIDTRTEGTNSNHRQVVVLGDPATNAGVAPVDATNGLSVTVVGALPAGTAAIGKLAANSGVDIGDVTLTANSGVDIGDVDVTSVVPGSGATNLGKAEDAAHVSGDVGVMALALRDDTLNVKSGTEDDYEPLHTDANGALWTHPTDSVAHDAADSGNGIKLAAKAVSSIEGVTVVAANDRTQLHADIDGQLLVKPLTTFGDIVSERVADTGGTSTNFTNFGAGGATARNYVTTVAVFNSSATDGYVDLRDGSAGSVIFTVPAPKGGGSVITFPVPLRQTTANTALAYDVSGAITTVYISVVGFQSNA